jgi:hypothetical protein
MIFLDALTPPKYFRPLSEAFVEIHSSSMINLSRKYFHVLLSTTFFTEQLGIALVCPFNQHSYPHCFLHSMLVSDGPKNPTV